VNPSTALARVVVDELVRHGVRHAVLCPGSRSAPLAYALQAAERAGRLRLHVRVDERSAGFLAIGLAKLTRVPAVVVTTSGTAVANLHPAVLEAHHGIVPLLVLSADRPPELRGTGANQTTVQVGMFGGALRWSHELGVPERRAGQQAGWRSQISRAVAAATGAGGGDAGPVHLNVPLREPLVPTEEEAWPESLDGRPHGRPWTTVDRPTATPGGDSSVVGAEPRTLVVLGDLPEPGLGDVALQWAAAHGWPVLAEPFGRHPRPEAVPHGSLLLSVPGWLEQWAPERVIVVGRVTLSRAVAALLRRDGVTVEAVPATTQWSDPSGVVSVVHAAAVLFPQPPRTEGLGTDDSTSAWAAAWHDAGAAVAKALVDDPAGWPSGAAVADTLLRSVPAGATVFAGSSNAARDLDLAVSACTATLTVVASRGLAGIDGCVSTATGLALAGDQPTYALMGDLTFLHDANGLLVGPHEPVPDVTIVVVNDDGGGIFTLLEPGEPERATDFERVFGTPTGTDLAALCAAHGVAHQRVASARELRAAVAAQPSGLRVVEVPVDRGGHRAARAHLVSVATRAVSR
jgi:2-succinyl-5-enolpyruvyl-6-hydroxy-3-cyclohexene-1-carboxylate synthase